MVRQSADDRPNRLGVVVLRHHTGAVSTWIALAGLATAALLAVFGLPPIDLHGPLHHLGVMDPLCGGTRSVYLTLHGQLTEAARYNPAGPVLVFAALALLIRAAIGWSTRHWLHVRLPRRIVIPLAVLALVALEVNQQMNAALLTHPWTGG